MDAVVEERLTIGERVLKNHCPASAITKYVNCRFLRLTSNTCERLFLSSRIPLLIAVVASFLRCSNMNEMEDNETGEAHNSDED